jgi:hypothetical protein
MFSVLRQARLGRGFARVRIFPLYHIRQRPHPESQAFSTTPARSSDVSKLILIGRLGREPEVRTTKSGDKEYVT